MTLLQEIENIATSTPFNNCAHCIHNQLMTRLADAGFGSEREVEAFYMGRKGIRRGRIDILAYRQGKRIGIEVDNCTPRPRSVLKLLGMQLDLRVMILRRNLKPIMPIEGIDGIFYIEPPRGFGGCCNS